MRATPRHCRKFPVPTSKEKGGLSSETIKLGCMGCHLYQAGLFKNRTIYNYCIFINTAIFLTHKYCYGYINTAKDLYILLGIYKYC